MSIDLTGQIDQLLQALASGRDALKMSAVAENQSASDMSTIISSIDLKRLAKTARDLNRRINEMSANAKTQQENAKTRQGVHARGLKELEKNLNQLLNKQPPVRNGG